ncbi:hypothetical protein SELMODRAFT_409592 [Selaginella moellendorffii]|uniref:Uncharacterized protein n=1 Tax=Selaginella moellendorffii TaxID=88036 RepID=D8RBY1_SELML|nr:hypothetical protein SELMODRAFT_409592 [Selaginella moellendorffii]
MPRESFEAVLNRALEAVERKAEHDDDLDWQAWNNREECTVGKRWTTAKLLRYRELWKLGASCVVRPGGKVVAVERKHQSFITAYVQRCFRPALNWIWMVEYLRFAYPPSGNIKFVSLQAHHDALHLLEPETGCFPWPRFILDVGQCQTLPELLSYKDAYFHSPGSKVQIFLALKCYLKTRMRQMVAVLFERDDAGDGITARAISFGEEALHPVTVAWLVEEQGILLSGVGHGGVDCDRPGIPGYQIELDTAKVLGGAGDMEAILSHCGDHFTVDLYWIKIEFLRYQEVYSRLPPNVV